MDDAAVLIFRNRVGDAAVGMPRTAAEAKSPDRVTERLTQLGDESLSSPPAASGGADAQSRVSPARPSRS